jgi:hypothetical protein
VTTEAAHRAMQAALLHVQHIHRGTSKREVQRRLKRLRWALERYEELVCDVYGVEIVEESKL